MDKIEKIRKEIAQLKGVKLYTFSEIRSEEPVADDLEEEVKNYFQGYWPGTETAEQCNTDLHFTPLAIMRLAHHFANWQKEQFEKNRLADCDTLTKEEYDRETAFAAEIIEKEHRQPTFTDAINYGMRLQREQMLKEAVEGEVIVPIYEGDDTWSSEIKIPGRYEIGDKVRIIVLPKED